MIHDPFPHARQAEASHPFAEYGVGGQHAHDPRRAREVGSKRWVVTLFGASILGAAALTAAVQMGEGSGSASASVRAETTTPVVETAAEAEAVALGAIEIGSIRPQPTAAVSAQADGDTGRTVRAARSVIVSGLETPTLWRGAPTARVVRARPPEWVETVRPRGPRRLPPEIAIAAAPWIEVVDVAPIWSPYLETAALTPSALTPSALTPSALAENALGESGVGASITADAIVLAAAAEPGVALDEASISVGAIATGSISVAPLVAKRPRLRPHVRPTVVAAVATPDNVTPAARLTETSAAPQAAGPQKTVAVVLTAFGVNTVASRAALKRLPREIALAVAPVADNAADWATRAQRDGRTVLIETPLEPRDYPNVDPGPLTLLTSLTVDENLARFADVLANAPTADGVATYLGGGFANDRGALRPIIEDWARRGLPVFDARLDGGEVASIAAEVGVPAQRPTVSLDKDGRARKIDAGLAELEAAARRDGHAIGVAVATPSTVDGLAAWAAKLERRGVRLVPLTF